MENSAPGGKIARFEALALPHLNAAYNLARWMMQSTSDAEEIAQEAILRAFHSFDTFCGTNGRVWLMTIVRNTYLTWIRRHPRRQDSAEFDEYLSGEIETSLTADSECLHQATGEQMRHAIENLPPEYREVILLRGLAQMTNKDIAAVTQAPLETVLSRITRGRSMLRKLIEVERRTKIKEYA
jgi:RNA polymerase sigma-70 factor, ECF subfamily